MCPLKDLERQQTLSKKLCEGNQMNEKLTGQIKTPNSARIFAVWKFQLESQMQKLQLHLVVHVKHMQCKVRENQLQRNYRLLRNEKRHPKVHRSMNEAYQNASLYRKMAEDKKNWREPERTTSFDQNQILFNEKSALGSWTVALLAERKLQELRKQKAHSWYWLAKAKFQFQPSPHGPFAPAVPPRNPIRPQSVRGFPRVIQSPRRVRVKLWELRDLGSHAGLVQISQ